LIHISELAHERVTNPSDLFKKGDDIEAVVLNIDPVDQRASLSRKRTLPGGPPVREESAGGTGANIPSGPSRAERFGTREGGANRYGGGGNRGNQGGGNKRGGYDYDYSSSNVNSANADAGGGKVTTKLGDVYADLFAQFGIGGGKKDEAKTEEKVVASAPAATPAEAPAPEATPAEAPAPESAPEATSNESSEA
jgi:small subunit ribosomal protein S1